MEKEIWKTIENFEDYEVSSLGRIRSNKFNKAKILKQPINDGGYKRITLKNKLGKITSLRVHRLVAKAFIPNPLKKDTVNHKDKNKENNNKNNLEWNTSLENITHKIKLIRDNESLLNGLCEKCKNKISQLLNN
jgi:hypothetical protein